MIIDRKEEAELAHFSRVEIARESRLSLFNHIFSPREDDQLDLTENQIRILPSCFMETIYIEYLFYFSIEIPLLETPRTQSRYTLEAGT